MSQVIKWKPKRKVKNKYGQPRCFAPPGRSHYVLYAVVLREHPSMVKVGRTSNWNMRKKHYADWNFAKGEGIERAEIFHITEEFVDLVKLENELLTKMYFPLVHGNEWFSADFDDVVKLIEEFLISYDVSYERINNL